MAAVRETSTLGPCNVLGPLVRETKTRFVYCPHPGQIAFARRSPRIHLEPCKCCPDHPASRYGHLLRAGWSPGVAGCGRNRGDPVSNGPPSAPYPGRKVAVGSCLSCPAKSSAPLWQRKTNAWAQNNKSSDNDELRNEGPVVRAHWQDRAPGGAASGLHNISGAAWVDLETT